MAVTNQQIILSEMAIHGITEKVDTYAGWNRKGKQVQRGEKALFTTSIWKPCKCKPKKDGETGYTKLILVKAAFFGESQVTEIEILHHVHV